MRKSGASEKKGKCTWKILLANGEDDPQVPTKANRKIAREEMLQQEGINHCLDVRNVEQMEDKRQLQSRNDK